MKVTQFFANLALVEEVPEPINLIEVIRFMEKYTNKVIVGVEIVDVETCHVKITNRERVINSSKST